MQYAWKRHKLDVLCTEHLYLAPFLMEYETLSARMGIVEFKDHLLSPNEKAEVMGWKPEQICSTAIYASQNGDFGVIAPAHAGAYSSLALLPHDAYVAPQTRRKALSLECALKHQCDLLFTEEHLDALTGVAFALSSKWYGKFIDVPLHDGYSLQMPAVMLGRVLRSLGKEVYFQSGNAERTAATVRT